MDGGDISMCPLVSHDERKWSAGCYTTILGISTGGYGLAVQPVRWLVLCLLTPVRKSNMWVEWQIFAILLLMDGRNPVLTSLGKGVLYPIIYRVLYIPGGCLGISSINSIFFCRCVFQIFPRTVYGMHTWSVWLTKAGYKAHHGFVGFDSTPSAPHACGTKLWSRRWDTTCWRAKRSKLYTIIICMHNTWTGSCTGNRGVNPACNPHPSQLFVTEWTKANSTTFVEKHYVPRSSQHSNVQKPTLWSFGSWTHDPFWGQWTGPQKRAVLKLKCTFR